VDSVEPDSTEFGKAEQQFRNALPSLLERQGMFGTWVLYSAEGLVETGRDEDSFFQRFGEVIGTKYFLGRVLPEPPEAEVTPNWYTVADRSVATRDPKTGS
jgi:hypothetical protein